MIEAEPTIPMDQVLVGFIFVPPLHSLAMQLIFFQENTTTSSSGLAPEENQHQRKPEEQVGLTISSNSVSRDKSFEWTIILKGGENNADEKENSSEVEKAEVPLKVKKSLSLLKARFTFGQ